MDITEFRRQYPQYGHVSDYELAQALYRKHYADRTDFDTFAQAFGVPKAPTVTVREPSALAYPEPDPAETAPSVLPGQPSAPLQAPSQEFIDKLYQRPTPAPETEGTPSPATMPGVAPGEPAPTLRPYPGRPQTREQKARAFLDRLRREHKSQAEMRPEQPPGAIKRGLERIFGPRGEVTPESTAESLIAAQAARHGMRPAQYAKDIGARTGLLERALEDLGSGAVGVGAGMLGYIARVVDAEGLTVAAGEVQAQATDLLPPDPNFVDELLSGFGSTAMFFVPGMGIVRGATAVAQVAPRMAYWLGAGAAAGMEAATEAGLVYQERIDQGATPEQAAASADATFFANTPLLVVTNRLGLFADRGSRLMRRSLAGVIEGPGQEGPQQIISNLATGRPWDEGVLTSAAIGAIVGTTLGGARTPAEVAGDRFARGIERTEFEVPAEEVAAAMLQPPPREPDVASEADVADVLEAPTVDDAIEEARQATDTATAVAEDIVDEEQAVAITEDMEAREGVQVGRQDIDTAAQEIATLTAEGRMEDAVALFEQTAAPLDETGVGELQARIQALRAAKEPDWPTIQDLIEPEVVSGENANIQARGRAEGLVGSQAAEGAGPVSAVEAEGYELRGETEADLARKRAETARDLERQRELQRQPAPIEDLPLFASPEAKGQQDIEDVTGAKRQSAVEVKQKARLPKSPPSVVYHGSPTKITKPTFGDDIGIHFGTEKAAQERLNVTNKGQGVIQPFSIDVKNPIEAIHDPGTWDIPNDALDALPLTPEQHETALDRMDAAGQSPTNQLDALANYLGELGYDGITYGNAFEGDQSWIVFDETQINRVKQQSALATREERQAREAPAEPTRREADPRVEAIGVISGGKVQQLEDAGYQIVYTDDPRARPLTREERIEAAGPASGGAIARLAEADLTVIPPSKPAAQAAPQPAKAEKPDLRLRLLMLPEQTIEVEETGEKVQMQESAAAAISRVDTQLQALYALRDCLQS